MHGKSTGIMRSSLDPSYTVCFLQMLMFVDKPSASLTNPVVLSFRMEKSIASQTRDFSFLGIPLIMCKLLSVPDNVIYILGFEVEHFLDFLVALSPFKGVPRSKYQLLLGCHGILLRWYCVSI